MDLEELNSKLDQNPDGNWKMRTLSELKDELEKTKRKSNSLGRENSDIGFKKWGEKRSNSTEKEAVKLLLNQTEQLPLKERIKELTKMIKTLVKYTPPRQLKIGESMDIKKLNEELGEVNKLIGKDIDIYGHPMIPSDVLPELEKIAKEFLDIDTLKTQYVDDKDFHDVGVWGVASALYNAYLLGQKSNSNKVDESRLNESDVPDMKTTIMRRLAADADGRDRNKMLFADDEDELGAMEMLLSDVDEITPDVENLKDIKISELSAKNFWKSQNTDAIVLQMNKYCEETNFKINKNEGNIIYCTQNNEVISFLQFINQENKAYFIYFVIVREDFRGKNLFEKMFTYLKKLAQKNKVPFLSSRVDKTNISSNKAHQKLGFKINWDNANSNGYVYKVNELNERKQKFTI